jgi:hypothetical protein
MLPGVNGLGIELWGHIKELEDQTIDTTNPLFYQLPIHSLFDQYGADID